MTDARALVSYRYSIADWPVIIRFAPFIDVLRDAEWGDPR